MLYYYKVRVRKTLYSWLENYNLSYNNEEILDNFILDIYIMNFIIYFYTYFTIHVSIIVGRNNM